MEKIKINKMSKEKLLKNQKKVKQKLQLKKEKIKKSNPFLISKKRS